MFLSCIIYFACNARTVNLSFCSKYMLNIGAVVLISQFEVESILFQAQWIDKPFEQIGRTVLRCFSSRT